MDAAEQFYQTMDGGDGGGGGVGYDDTYEAIDDAAWPRAEEKRRGGPKARRRR